MMVLEVDSYFAWKEVKAPEGSDSPSPAPSGKTGKFSIWQPT
jgi:hypothetical protein